MYAFCYCCEFLGYKTKILSSESSLQGWRNLASLCCWLICSINQTLIIQRETSATQKYKKYDFCLLFPIYLTIGAILRCLNATKKNVIKTTNFEAQKQKLIIVKAANKLPFLELKLMTCVYKVLFSKQPWTVTAELAPLIHLYHYRQQIKQTPWKDVHMLSQFW